MTDEEARRIVRAGLFEAGATLSTAVYGGREHLTAWLPNGTPDDVVRTAQADGWVVVLGKPLQWIDRGEAEEQPHATSIALAAEPALRCPDAERDAVPVTGDVYRTLSDARRAIARCSPNDTKA